MGHAHFLHERGPAPVQPDDVPRTQREVFVEHIADLHKRNEQLQAALDKLVGADARATLLEQENQELKQENERLRQRLEIKAAS